MDAVEEAEKWTLEKWNAHVAETNAKFLAASRAEKRVMLAEDIITQLKMGRIVAKSTYLLFPDRKDFYENGMELRGVISTVPLGECSACGIGALFITAIQRLDALSYKEFFDYRDGRMAIHNYLDHHDLFTSEELDNIENYFEGVYGATYSTRTSASTYTRPTVTLSAARTKKLEFVMELIIELRGAPLPEWDSFILTMRGKMDALAVIERDAALAEYEKNNGVIE